MYGNKREMMNVHLSNTNEVVDRQESCNFTIFLQHTNGLSDGQEISIVARLELEKSFSDSNMTIERLVTYYARTTILVIFVITLFNFRVFFKINSNSLITRKIVSCLPSLFHQSFLPVLEIVAH